MVLANFGDGEYVVSKVRFCYILTFCHNKISHRFSQNVPSNQKHQNDVFWGNGNKGASPKPKAHRHKQDQTLA